MTENINIEKLNKSIKERKNACPELTWMEVILSFIEERNLGVLEEDKIAVEELASVVKGDVLQCLYEEQLNLRNITSERPKEKGFF